MRPAEHQYSRGGKRDRPLLRLRGAARAPARTLEQADQLSDWLVPHTALLASLCFEPRLPWVASGYSSGWYSSQWL